MCLNVEANKLISKLFSTEGLVIPKPCWLCSIIIFPAEVLSSLIRVYDGWNTTGKIILDLSGNQYKADIVILRHPIFFGKGVFVEFVSNGYCYFVQYRLLF